MSRSSLAEHPCIAYIALGANLGQPEATLQAAIAALQTLPGARFAAVSSLYRTAPLGLKDQPDFINAVAALSIDESTPLTPQELLARLFTIETYFGRQRSIANAARTLDLDLLLYGETVLNTADLTLPHPRMHQRAFVLAPLLEINPFCIIPGHGPADRLLAACHDQAIEKLV